MQIANFYQRNLIVVIQKVTFLLTSSKNAIKVDNYGEYNGEFQWILKNTLNFHNLGCQQDIANTLLMWRKNSRY